MSQWLKGTYSIMIGVSSCLRSMLCLHGYTLSYMNKTNGAANLPSAILLLTTKGQPKTSTAAEIELEKTRAERSNLTLNLFPVAVLQRLPLLVGRMATVSLALLGSPCHSYKYIRERVKT